MIDLNRKPVKKQEEVPTEIVIGLAIVVGAWMVWAFLIGGML